MEGIVDWFNAKKRFGFVTGDDGEKYFLHLSAIPKGTFIRENDKISFDPADSDKGKQAQNVQLIQKGSEMDSEQQNKQSNETSTEETPQEDSNPEPSEEF